MSDESRWSEVEFKAAVEGYIEMLEFQQLGKTYNKSSINQRLRDGPLAQRTKSSVEYRMQNISAVLDRLGLPWVKGYTPARNVGTGASLIIEKYILALNSPLLEKIHPTADKVELELRTIKLREAKLETPPSGQILVRQETQTVGVYVRDPQVRAWVLNSSNGICEGCKQPAPFTTMRGEPFLEVHHVKWLAEGGTDRVENAVALCPNCHRRCHLSNDRENFRETLYRGNARLMKE